MGQKRFYIPEYNASGMADENISAETFAAIKEMCRLAYHGLNSTKPLVTCSAYRTWLLQVKEEQKHYPLFKGRELDEDQLLELWKEGRSPIDALNALATAC